MRCEWRRMIRIRLQFEMPTLSIDMTGCKESQECTGGTRAKRCQKTSSRNEQHCCQAVNIPLTSITSNILLPNFAFNLLYIASSPALRSGSFVGSDAVADELLDLIDDVRDIEAGRRGRRGRIEVMGRKEASCRSGRRRDLEDCMIWLMQVSEFVQRVYCQAYSRVMVAQLQIGQRPLDILLDIDLSLNFCFRPCRASGRVSVHVRAPDMDYILPSNTLLLSTHA